MGSARGTTTWIELKRLAVYLRALRRFLREPLDEAVAFEHVRERLARREDTFLRILADGVFGNPIALTGSLFGTGRDRARGCRADSSGTRA